MMSKKQRQRYMSAVQTEQLKLVKMQNALESLITKVNESINALKVEELQLKSSAVVAMQNNENQSCSVAEPDQVTSITKFEYDLDNDVKHMTEMNNMENGVNKQEIDLDLFVGCSGRHLEEEEEDDDMSR